MSGIYSFSRVHLWAVGNCSWEDFSFTVKEKERVLAGSWPNLCSLSLSLFHTDTDMKGRVGALVCMDASVNEL